MTSPPNRPDLRGIGESAFMEVLETILRLSPKVENPATRTTHSDTRDQISSSVLLTGPGLSGSVHVQLPKSFVAQAVQVLTGIEGAAAQANGLVDDTAGELTNMVAGRIAMRLTEDGYACSLGTPSVFRNAQLPNENETAIERGRADLICEGYWLAVEIQFRYTAL